MKLRKLLNVLAEIEDERKLPYDALEDFNYKSHSNGCDMSILDMDLIHLIRAFKILSRRVEYTEKYTPIYRGRELVLEKIPNDDDGKKLVSLLRKHLNRDGYKMRVRGQNVSEPYKKKNCGRCHTYHGQEIAKSKNLRIYFDRLYDFKA